MNRRSDHGARDTGSEIRAGYLERARKLSRRLRVQVVIDDSGWMRRGIELVITKEPGGYIQPVTVRVGCEARDDDVLGEGGVVAQCQQYNAALRSLQRLSAQLATSLAEGAISLVDGSTTAYAYGVLSRLDELIARRQAIAMGYGIVAVAVLRRETEFFARCDAQLTPLVSTATPVPDVRAPRNCSPARRRWLWRWPTRRVATQSPTPAATVPLRSTP